MKITTLSKGVRLLTLFIIIIGLLSVVFSTFDFMRPYWRSLAILGFVGGGYFAVEYLLRLREAYVLGGRKRVIKYVLSFMGVVDLLAVLPFLAPLFISSDSSIITIMIYCRLVLIFKLRRYSRSFNTLSAAINSVRKPLMVAISLPLMVATVSALFFYYVEAPLQPEKLQDLGDAFYWVIITMATVGYGDIVPVSEAGKLLAILTALSGVFIIAIPSGLLSSAFINIMRQKPESKRGRNLSASRAVKTSALSGDIYRRTAKKRK